MLGVDERSFETTSPSGYAILPRVPCGPRELVIEADGYESLHESVVHDPHDQPYIRLGRRALVRAGSAR